MNVKEILQKFAKELNSIDIPWPDFVLDNFCIIMQSMRDGSHTYDFDVTDLFVDPTDTEALNTIVQIYKDCGFDVELHITEDPWLSYFVLKW